MKTVDQVGFIPRFALSGDSSGSVRVKDAYEIRPFHVSAPEEELTELRRRINATKRPDRETVTDASQGVQLAIIQELARYWAMEYDWREIHEMTRRAWLVFRRVEEPLLAKFS